MMHMCRRLLFLVLAPVINDTPLGGKHLVHDPEDGPEPKEHQPLEHHQQPNNAPVRRPGVVLAAMERPGIDDMPVQEMPRVDPDDHEAGKDWIADHVRHANVLEALAKRQNNIRQIHGHKNSVAECGHVENQRSNDQQSRDEVVADHGQKVLAGRLDTEDKHLLEPEGELEPVVVFGDEG